MKTKFNIKNTSSILIVVFVSIVLFSCTKESKVAQSPTPRLSPPPLHSTLAAISRHIKSWTNCACWTTLWPRAARAIRPQAYRMTPTSRLCCRIAWCRSRMNIGTFPLAPINNCLITTWLVPILLHLLVHFILAVLNIHFARWIGPAVILLAAILRIIAFKMGIWP